MGVERVLVNSQGYITCLNWNDTPKLIKHKDA